LLWLDREDRPAVFALLPTNSGLKGSEACFQFADFEEPARSESGRNQNPTASDGVLKPEGIESRDLDDLP
jgi:hypothetical protein